MTKNLTWTELAVKLGISRQQVYQHRNNPDSPGLPDLKKWKAFLSERRLHDPNFTTVRFTADEHRPFYFSEAEFYG